MVGLTNDKWKWSHKTSVAFIFACTSICKQLDQSSRLIRWPMLAYCQSDPKEHISVKFYLKFGSFKSGKCTWKSRLLKWRPSCLTSMCLVASRLGHGYLIILTVNYGLEFAIHTVVFYMYSLWRHRLIDIGIPSITLRWSSGHLRFIMGIHINVRQRRFSDCDGDSIKPPLAWYHYLRMLYCSINYVSKCRPLYLWIYFTTLFFSQKHVIAHLKSILSLNQIQHYIAV